MEIIQLTPEKLNRKILDILDELSPTKNTTLAKARKIIKSRTKNNHLTYVIYEDTKAVGIGSLVIMEKLSYRGKSVGLIEDVVITNSCRGKGYGKQLIKFLEDKAIELKCRKLVLYCAEHNVDFYKKSGFIQKEFLMRKRLNAITRLTV